jgi:hypothetical protein
MRIKHRASPARASHVSDQITRLVVDVGNRADAWRDAALDAEGAFVSWKNAAHAERDTAAAVYLAAIEREEKAASEYSRASEACCAAVPETRVWVAPRSRGSRRRWRPTYECP